MKNQYLKNLNKVEFVVTCACTGKCKHCSEGDHKECGERIDPQIAYNVVKSVAAEYCLETVMAFGGEPLLCTDAVFAIMTAAKEVCVPRRQVITNGYFSKNADRIREVAKQLSKCGVNDLLLSVDCFHQETIPKEIVMLFAKEAIASGIPVRLQPAWLVSPEDKNPYNIRTREILDSFSDLDIPEGIGNVIFPEGNAKRYLAEYFKDACPENPYEEDPGDVRCVSFSPNGDVLFGNAYRTDILKILASYTPA